MLKILHLFHHELRPKKKASLVSRLAFVLFKPVLHRFFGQLDNAQFRDRFGQLRRRLSVIHVP